MDRQPCLGFATPLHVLNSKIQALHSTILSLKIQALSREFFRSLQARCPKAHNAMPNLTPSRQQARAGILARSAIVNDEELLGFVGVGLKAFGVIEPTFWLYS